VSPVPDPPLGAPDSVRVFRAGKNHYYVKLLAWGLAQIGAAIGLLFSIGFVTSINAGTRAILALPRPITAAPSATSTPTGSTTAPAVATAATDRQSRKAAPQGSAPPSVAASVVAGWPSPLPANAGSQARRNRNRDVRAAMVRALNRLSATPYFPILVNYVLPFLVFLEYFGVATFVALFVATYFMARLEYEQHWYIVTDRSLRIRTGVLSLSESTMSFANIQQVEVKQGPVQTLLGLADVRVQSAGGGSSQEESGQDPLHTGVFHNVENASEIRDLILARLRAFRETGLGDPTEKREPPSRGADSSAGRLSGSLAPALAAAREVVAEARALRRALDHGVSTVAPEQAPT
jgi:membrane protein YdbS with pleckstrin-like domain